MGLETNRTDETLYARHVDGFRLDVVTPRPEEYELGAYEGREVIADGESLSDLEISGLAHYEATGGAEGEAARSLFFS